MKSVAGLRKLMSVLLLVAMIGFTSTTVLAGSNNAAMGINVLLLVIISWTSRRMKLRMV